MCWMWLCLPWEQIWGNGLQPLQISRSQRGSGRAWLCPSSSVGFSEDEEPQQHPQATLCPGIPWESLWNICHLHGRCPRPAGQSLNLHQWLFSFISHLSLSTDSQTPIF